MIDTCPIPASDHACAKMILVGEHAAVYGATAVAMPITKMRITLNLTPTQNYIKDSPKHNLTLSGRNVSDHVSGLISDAFKVLGLKPYPVNVDGFSTVLMGAGLGSSAALSVALVRVIAKSAGMVLSAEKIASVANDLEKRFHGNPSGLDSSVVSSESCISFAKGKGFTPLTISNIQMKEQSFPWKFAIIDSSVRSPTVAMIQVAQPYFQKDTEAKIQKFNFIAEETIAALASGNHGQLACAMNDAGELLEEAGVVNEPLRTIICGAKELGVAAAKATGAGGGGCVVALLDPIKSEEQLRNLKSTFGSQRVFDVQLC